MNSIAPSAQPTSDVDTPPITVSSLVRHPSTDPGPAKLNTVAGETVVVGAGGEVGAGTGTAVVTTAATVVSADPTSEPDNPQAPSPTTAIDIAAVTIARRRITRMQPTAPPRARVGGRRATWGVSSPRREQEPADVSRACPTAGPRPRRGR